MDERSDESLMSAICKGDQAAFAVLVERHIDSLYTYALRLLRSATDADDLVQETWLSVWCKAATFKPGRVKLTTWLHRILHNKYVDDMRRKRPLLDEDLVAAQPDPGSPSTSLEQAQQMQQLEDAIAQLPDNQKVALLLSLSQGMSNREIAQILGQSVRAVESSLARARQNLKAQLLHHRHAQQRATL